MVTVVVVVVMLKKESQIKGNRKSSSFQQWFSGLTDSFAYFPTKSCSSVFLLFLSPPRQVDQRFMKVNQEPSVLWLFCIEKMLWDPGLCEVHVV